ncbi:MAG: diaminopimelate epimerase [Verrucomicrobia bacterium]|nr:diaminopimelate epimerase [Verrucomicrobiota bacterium]MDA1068272.1 diaminopimelate epimerase [Verrucomicrobiota bacterium]
MPTLFYKYHALGNDYLVLDSKEVPSIFSIEQIKLICHRNFGLGSDGILHGPFESDGAKFGLRIYNPDGSEAEKSGNGLRIFCRYLFDQGLVKNEPFTLWTLGGVVTCQVFDSGKKIDVEMGAVSFSSSDIPVMGPHREVINEPIELSGKTYTYCAATIGNPHAVFPMDNISKELACSLGPHVEVHENFPNRTNVQFLKVLDRNNIQIEIWERGAGYTLASGSSSSAAAAVAHKLGLVGENITVHMPGGLLEIQISEGYRIRMVGPTTRVGKMIWDDQEI